MNKVFAVVCACVLLFGCASAGRKLDSSKLDKIKPGETTRAQLREWFGAPRSVGADKDGNKMETWVYVYIGPYGIGNKTQQLVAVFGPDDKVLNYNVTDDFKNSAKSGEGSGEASRKVR